MFIQVHTVFEKSKMSSGPSGPGGSGGTRNFAGRKPDPIRNSFETIRTPENLAKPLQLQKLRCKVCMEKVSGRPDRLKEHKTKCMSFPSQVRLKLFTLDQWYNFVYQGSDSNKRVKLCKKTIWFFFQFLYRENRLHPRLHRQLHLQHRRLHPQVPKPMASQDQRKQILWQIHSSPQHQVKWLLCRSSGLKLFSRIASPSLLLRTRSSRRQWKCQGQGLVLNSWHDRAWLEVCLKRNMEKLMNRCDPVFRYAGWKLFYDMTLKLGEIWFMW